MADRAPWGSASNWGARDHDKYQRELDELVEAGELTRERERERRYNAWVAEHAHGEVWISEQFGARCEKCGGTFNG